jgi:hypothetical protein
LLALLSSCCALILGNLFPFGGKKVLIALVGREYHFS